MKKKCGVGGHIANTLLAPAPKNLKGTKTSGKQSIEVANQIYSYYREVIEKFEGLIRTTANVKYLMPNESPMEMESFFGDDRFHGEEVTWWVDSQTPVTFRPKITGSRQQFNPLFKRDQLIDRNKWTKMQKALELNEYPSDEMMELLRIRSQLAWRRKKSGHNRICCFCRNNPSRLCS